MAANPVVQFDTSLGSFTLELDAAKAPVTVENFLQYVKSGFYNGTIFHRVIPRFMVQGGGFDMAMRQKQTKPTIRNEAGNGLKNLRGTVAMARTSDIHSATAQFFVNVVDNAFLDHQSDRPDEFGYCVFGKVTQGMDVVDKIVAVPTRTASGHENVPNPPVLVRKAALSE
jgi:cyclophilin family peptidyl-prolyl cis-trans isomerase